MEFNLPGIEDETTVRPRYAAEGVYDEAESYIKRYGLKLPDEELTIEWLMERADTLYRKNSAFRSKMQGEGAERHLTECMRKWLGTKWSKTNPELYSRLPDKFTGGFGLL